MGINRNMTRQIFEVFLINHIECITPERRRAGKRRRVKMETESQSQAPRRMDDMVNIGEDESAQYSEGEMPTS